jgi:hypothetical protein
MTCQPRLFSGCDSHVAASLAQLLSRNLLATTSRVRKLRCTKLPSAVPMRSLRDGTIAVCGMGTPIGCRNSAVTANQSAMPPTMAASAKARMYPTHA